MDVTISAFARRVGLTPSALRFYDDCDVLRPARVDELTGYRFYSPDQEPRAVALRDLRAAGLPLAEVTAVLDGPPARARETLEAHRERVRKETEAAHSAIERILRSLPETSTVTSPAPWRGPTPTALRLGGVELASAVRQVVPSTAVGGEFEVLGCVLIELGEDEIRLVATDRYRLAIRVLPGHGGSGQLLVPAADLTEIAKWAVHFREIALEINAGGARVVAAAQARTLPTFDGEFPAYREVLANHEPPRHRVIVDRLALRDALSGDRVVLAAGGDALSVGRTVTLPAICTGAPVRIGFDPAVLAPALETSVGPDVLLEITATFQPVVVRSADQGSFTTLVMPVALPEGKE